MNQNSEPWALFNSFRELRMSVEYNKTFITFAKKWYYWPNMQYLCVVSLDLGGPKKGPRKLNTRQCELSRNPVKKEGQVLISAR